MSELLTRLKADQLTARKARDTATASLLSTVISEATKLSAEDYKKGVTEATDERVLRTLKSFVSNLDLAIESSSTGAIGVGLTNHAKFLAERETLIVYIPSELSEDALRSEVVALARETGKELTVRDTGTVKTALEARFPGQINAKALSGILKEGVS